MRGRWLVAGCGLALAGCATGPARPPVEAVRFHYDAVAARGPIAVEAAGTDAGPEQQAFAAAVAAELSRIGFTPVASGPDVAYRASVEVTRTERPLPPRSSGVSIGIGGASFGGGGRRGGGGVGLGGGVTFPVGGDRGRLGVVTELAVRIRRGPDAVWEGQARTLAPASAPEADTAALAPRLAGALFGGFPGESGRTVEVR